ncbi:BTAD domain-containing putative transcriptional regulator [Modestobacter versicolor]|uniref:BTAD domain-containing putative transcriptional regulator n=1 Tax=Modestobacter versicolor TaxID=429133 RepID=UPI0034DF9131
MPVVISLLGPVAAVGDDGQPVDVGGPRSRALLARLAAEPGRVVGLGTLIDAVWDADPPAAPGNAVQALVSRLRRALPTVPLRARAHGYLLDLPADAVDAGRFEALVARARDEQEPGRSLALLREAEALWRGPALADLRDLAFAAPLAARWADLRLAAAEQRLAGELAEGSATAALPELEDLVAAHPLREPLCLLLVRALARLGRTAEALAAYERCRDRLADELGLDPSPALQAEHLAVLRGEAASPGAPRAGGALRSPLTSFRGRDDELDAVAALLDSGRLVTLLGPGGAGKTRLALEAAHRRRADVPDGVWWVELAPVADARLLPAAVLSAVGQREGTSLERVPTLVEAGARLQETFADRRALLVLDNCEHLVGAVARFADDLLASCPGLQVLTTSREPLGVPGEVVLPVGPLAVPDAADADAAAAPVVRLFADRAVAVRPDFAVTPATLPAVLEVCRRLDGMPLALELAAARLRTLGVAQIAARLDDRFSLLTGGSRVALPRHQTLRAVVEWSWDALDAREQAVARRLSVFTGGAALDAAEQVCADPLEAVGDVLDAITGLVEKSMLLAVDDGSGGVRYRMLETIRAYAAEQLDAAGERAAVEAAQAAWCLRLVDELDPQLRRADQLAALRRLDAEQDGLLAVLQRAVAAGDGDVAVHLGARMSWYWLLTGRQLAAGRWLREAVAVPGGAPAMRAMCVAFGAMGRAEGEDWQAMLPVLREVGDLPPEDTYRSDEPLGALAWAIAMVFAGGFRSVAGLALLEDHPDPWVVAAAHGIRAQVAENIGELDGLEADLRQAHAEFEQLGDRWGRSFTAAALSQLSSADGDGAAAIAWLTEAIELSEQLGTTDDTPMLRIRLAMAHALAGDLPRAEADAAAVLAELGADGGGLHVAMAEAAAGGFALLAGRLDDAERWHGRAMDHVRAASGGPPQIGAMVEAGTAVVLAARAEAAPDRAADLLDQARLLLRSALQQAAEAAGDMPVTAAVLQAMAAVALAEGDPQRAADLLGRSAAVRGRRDRGDLGAAATERRLRAELGDAGFERVRDAGAAVPREEVLAGLGVDAGRGWAATPMPSGGGQTRRR